MLAHDPGMKIGILGSGAVAQALGAGLLRHGHAVMLGTGHAAKLAAWQREHSDAQVGGFDGAARFAELAVLAVKGTAAADAVRAAGPANLEGKVVIDTTNPIANAPPVEGVLSFFTSLDDSLLERLQSEFPAVRFVKAFNSVGSASMIDPRFAGGKPTMFVCGDDAAARTTVTSLLHEVGWEVEDMGGAVAARAIEPLCILWCIPGFQHGDWVHAFKLLR